MWWTLPIGCGPHLPPGEAPQAAAEAPVVVERVGGSPERARFDVTVAAGSARDPLGREGTAWVVADVVFRPLAADGRTVRWTTTVDRVEATLDCPAAEAGACAVALAAALSAPGFSDDGLALARGAALAGMPHGDDDALVLGALPLVVFRGHPYGHAPSGRTSVLPTLTTTELQRYHQQRYTRPSIRLTVAGAVSDDLLGTLRSELGALRPGADALRPHGGDAPFPPLAAPGTWVLVRPPPPEPAPVTIGLAWTDAAAVEELSEWIGAELADAALVDTWTVIGPGDDDLPLVRALVTTSPDRVGAVLEAVGTCPGGVSAVAVVGPDQAAALSQAEPHPVVSPADALYR